MTLKTFRKIEKLKQEEVAKELGVTTIAYGHWENGLRQPKIEMLPKLAQIFNCRIEDIVRALLAVQRRGGET